MPQLKFSSFSDLLLTSVCCLLAIALQVQITLFQSQDYLGLRISSADILSVIVAPLIFYTLVKRQSLWPVWNIRHVYIGLVTLTLIFGSALIHTHFTYGEMSRWALINKFGGWLILMLLLGIGGWIGQNATQRHLELFLKTLLYFAFLIITLQLLAMVGQTYWQGHLIPYNTYAHYPIEGHMANRNAFALMYLAVFSLSTCFYFSGNGFLPRWYAPAFFFLMPFFIVFNSSRAMIIALCLMLFVFTVCNRTQLRKLFLLLGGFLLGSLLLIALYYNKQSEISMLRGDQLSFTQHLDILTSKTNTSDTGSQTATSPEENTKGDNPEDLQYPGDSMRLTILADAKDMIAQHPLIGSGLGSMLLYQKEKHGYMINLIDCTPLWLWVETGLIGLLAFAAFYIQSFRGLYTGWKEDAAFIRTFRLGIIASMACFTVMCLFHEIMYTRFVWVLLGMGLTLKTRPAE